MEISISYSDWCTKNTEILNKYDENRVMEFPSNEFQDQFYYWLFQVKNERYLKHRAPWDLTAALMAPDTCFTQWGRKHADECIVEFQTWWEVKYMNRYEFFNQFYNSENDRPLPIEEYRKYFKKDFYFENAISGWGDHKYSNFMNCLFFDIVKDIFKECENTIRSKHSVPLIGEGWVNETGLFYFLKEYFDKTDVVHHGKPEFLGLQHFDVYLPEYEIAVEYQGIQHTQPVEYFGGEEAFKKNQERDKRKKKLSKENGVALIEVFPDYDEKKLIRRIESIIAKSKSQ